ncbi:MAG: ATP-dependent protease, partial [Ruminiclostridium sp.]
NGQQGVIIPYQNIKNLILNDEVINAVRKKLFHIYPVKTIDEGIELLTDMESGEKGADGKYKKSTINYLVCQKLEHFASAVLNSGKRIR